MKMSSIDLRPIHSQNIPSHVLKEVIADMDPDFNKQERLITEKQSYIDNNRLMKSKAKMAKK